MNGNVVWGTELGWAALAVAAAFFLVVSILGWRRSWAGALLRGLAFLCVAVLALRPEVVHGTSKTARKRLAAMLDASRSMACADAEGASRFARVRAVIGIATEAFEVERFCFDAEARRAETAAPGGKATSLSGALDAAGRAGADVVLLGTDGGHNLGSDPVEAARRLGRPVHVLFSGPWPPASNLHVEDMRAPEEVEEGESFRVTAEIAAAEWPGNCAVRLLIDGDESAKKLIRAGAKVSFVASVRGEGTHVVTIEAEPFEGEEVVEDNSRSLVVFAKEAPLNAAYVEGLFRPDFGAISSALRGGKLPVEIVRAFAKDAKLPRADVYLVGEADADSAFVEPLLGECRRGAGLVALPGGRWLNEFLAGDWSGESHDEAELRLTPAGEKALGQIELPRAKAILRARLREGTETLVETSRGEPVVAAAKAAGGSQARAVQVFSRALFRWDRAALGRLLEALSRWSAGKGPSKGLTVRLSRYRMERGGAVGVRIEAPEGAEPVCRLRAGGEETPVELVERGGFFLGVLSAEEPGIHEVVATDGRSEARVHLQVLGEDREARFPPDRPLLERIARATGGRVWKPGQFEEMKRELEGLGGVHEVEIRTARALWDSPWLLAAFVVLMTAEWFLASRGARS